MSCVSRTGEVCNELRNMMVDVLFAGGWMERTGF